jgi:predicted RNase H-like HicB family nuclease
MNTYHIRIEMDDDWYVLQAEEDQGIFSQSRTLDEAVIMIRDVLDLLKGEKDAELRLIVPATLPVDDARQSGRFTHPAEDDEEDVAPPAPPPPLSMPPEPRRTAS